MTLALTYFLMKLLRRNLNRCEGGTANFLQRRSFLLQRRAWVAYPVRTRGRLDSTGSP